MSKQSFFKKINNNFIETGSYVGDGIQLALDSGFDNIKSIELSEHFHDICKKRFKNETRVELILGDSGYKLKEILEVNSETPFTYWLDGHYSGGNTACSGIGETPLIYELDAILKRDIKNEIIYIDDMRCYSDYSLEINFNKINELVQRYRTNYYISYEASSHAQDDILIIEY
jgi:hypothetical protein